MLLAAGCGPATGQHPLRSSAAGSSAATSASTPRAPASSASQATAPAPANAAFAPIQGILAKAGPPVLLPSWLPAPGAGRSYYLTATASADTYAVQVATTVQPAAPNSLASSPMADLLAEIQAGAPGTLGPSPALAPTTAQGMPVALPGGLTGTFYPQTADRLYSLLQWRDGGWTFQVADLTGLGADATALRSPAQALVQAASAATEPVPGVATGTVVQLLAPDSAAVVVVWQAAGFEYRLEGYNAPAIRLAQSLVPAEPQGAEPAAPGSPA